MARVKKSNGSSLPTGRLTRSKTRHMLIDGFSKCAIRITKIPYFDQLLRSQRSAKIIARRCTVAVDSSVSHSVSSGRSALFKKVTNRPFTNRRASVCSQNMSHAPVANEIPVPGANRNVSIDQQSSIIGLGIDTSSVELFNVNASLTNVDDEQHDNSVSQLITNGNSNQSNSVACILDSMVPDNSPIPLVPVKVVSVSDDPVPDGLPAPLMPQPKRSIPDLIPIFNFKFQAMPKQYTGGRARRTSAAQFILDSLENYEKQVVDIDFDNSDEDFGRLVYSDSE